MTMHFTIIQMLVGAFALIAISYLYVKNIRSELS